MALNAFKFLEEKYGFKKAENFVYHGKYEGYYSCLVYDKNKGASTTIGISYEGSKFGLETRLEQLKSEKKIINFKVNEYNINFTTGTSLSGSIEKKMAPAYDEIIEFLKQEGYKSGCYITGRDENMGFYKVDENYSYLSASGKEALVAEFEEKKQSIHDKKENILFGLIGALLGGAIGGAIWFGVSLLGYYVWAVGLITVLLAYKGYQLFAGKVGKIGAVIVFLVSLLSIFAGSVFEWTYYFYESLSKTYTGVSFFDVLPETLPIIFSEPELQSKFLVDLAIGLGIVFIISLIFIVQLYKKGTGKYDFKQFE